MSLVLDRRKPECGICTNPYNAKRKPMVGVCGHSVCQFCRVQLEELDCPNCREQASFSRETVNYALLEVVEHEPISDNDEELAAQERAAAENRALFNAAFVIEREGDFDNEDDDIDVFANEEDDESSYFGSDESERDSVGDPDVAAEGDVPEDDDIFMYEPIYFRFNAAQVDNNVERDVENQNDDNSEYMPSDGEQPYEPPTDESEYYVSDEGEDASRAYNSSMIFSNVIEDAQSTDDIDNVTPHEEEAENGSLFSYRSNSPEFEGYYGTYAVSDNANADASGEYSGAYVAHDEDDMADDNLSMSSGSASSYRNSDDAMYSEGEEGSDAHNGEYRNEDEIADEDESVQCVEDTYEPPSDNDSCYSVPIGGDDEYYPSENDADPYEDYVEDGANDYYSTYM